MSSVGSAAARRKGGGLPYFMFLCKGLNVQPEAWTRSWTSDTTATLSPPLSFCLQKQSSAYIQLFCILPPVSLSVPHPAL